jgi:curved DNA-binding protein CbpA
MSNQNSTKEKLDQDVDYYEVLGIPSTSAASDIKKAYRNLARIYHPDVNDSPEAEQLFVKIQKAHHVLTDAQLKAEFDGIIKAKVLHKQRLDGMNSKRRLQREELEQREEAAKRVKLDGGVEFVQNNSTVKKPDPKKQAEKIRESGGYDALHKMFQAKQSQKQAQITAKPKSVDVIVKWNKTGTMKNKLVDDKLLQEVFETLFGPVLNVVKIEKKRKAIVTFQSGLHAQAATEYWRNHPESEFMFDVTPVSTETTRETPVEPNKTDYESITLQRLRQMSAERKQREELLKNKAHAST